MTQPLTESQINEALAKLDGWSHTDGKLTKTVKFKHFREAISFIVRVAFEAEERNHHPELFNVYNKVEIGLSTHDAGGKVTQLDIDLAQAIDHLNWRD